MATFDEFYASLDADSNVRGDQFEKKFAIWFLKTDPTWASQVEAVWRWDDYPRRSEWGTDCGVDIILHHTNGERWAVQAKCFSPDNYLNKDELNSFIAESSDERFQGKLLISSTNKIGPNADKLLNRHKVVRILLKDLRDADINYPSSIKNLYKGSPVKKYDPQPHQKDAINDVLEKLKKVNKGQVLMACGSGKTLTALWIKESLFSKNTLVLLPSLSLLGQTVKNWNTHKNQPFKWLCVCSDKTVARDKKNKDEWIGNPSELGISVTSEVIKIKEFLSLSGEKVIFSSYQSCGLICEVQQIMRNFAFDLTIADEAHNCTGRVETYFGNILDDQKIRTTKKLFFTATPKILSKQIKTKAKEREIEIASMDDKSKFGEVLHKLNFSSAIKQKILTDYQVSIVGVTNQEVSKMIKLRDLIKTYENYNFDAESLGTFVAIIKSIKNYGLRKLISFHNLIDNADVFSQLFPLIAQFFKENVDVNIHFDSDYVSGKMTASEKDEKIQKLRSLDENCCFVLSNARCLSEGVDVPSLDGVAFIDPKYSPIDIVQAVGRAIRKSNKKTKGTIIIPVFLDDIENINEQILSSKFSTVWSVITALKSQDDELMEKIDNLRIQLGSRKITKITSKGLEKIHFDLPEKINAKFYESLYTVLVENTSDDWLSIFGKLKAYKEKYGHASPNLRENILGNWCQGQRKNYKSGKLSEERVNLLEEIGFDWDPFETEWQNKFNELKEFKKKFGHVNPNTQKSVLGKWTAFQRSNYRKGILSKERIASLERIGFNWDLLEIVWKERSNELKEFKKQYGHANPHSQNSPLGRWCQNQRNLYKKGNLSNYKINFFKSIGYELDPLNKEWQSKFAELKDIQKNDGKFWIDSKNVGLKNWCVSQRISYKSGKLSEERVNLLNGIGFDWDPLETEWQFKIDELKKIKQDSSHRGLMVKNKNFQNWCITQRLNYKKGVLPQEKINVLENLGFDWDPLETEWQSKFNELSEYKKQHGNATPYKKVSKLGSWCSSQREAYKKKTIAKERISLLESIGFDWDPLETEWSNKFNELKEFKKKYGHVNPPARGFSISGWCSRLRTNYKNYKLPKEKISLLESIGFDWNPLETEWKNKFNELKEFKKKYGHTSPNIKGNTFGNWCGKQRTNYKSGKLSKERIDLLEEIGFDWDPQETEWRNKFNELKEFKMHFGHLNAPTSDKGLGRWCGKQRYCYREGTLSEEKIMLLKNIGFNFVVN